MGFSLKSFLGGSKGPNNPYAPIDFASLLKTDLESPGNQYNTDGAFQALLGNLNAPSSVDSVQSQVDSQRMQELLKGINIDTNNAVGSAKSDFLDRGLGGPGQMSDIESIALAQTRGAGADRAAAARGTFASQELGRLKAKENAVASAYGQRYQDMNQSAEAARARALQRLLGITGAQSSAYGQAEALKQSGSKPGLLEGALGQFTGAWAKEYGGTRGMKMAGG